MFKIYTVNVKASSNLKTLFVAYLDFSMNLKSHYDIIYETRARQCVRPQGTQASAMLEF